MNIADQTYLIKLYAVLEKVKQIQLGLDKESRLEYRNLEKSIIKKIKEVQTKPQSSLKESMV